MKSVDLREAAFVLIAAFGLSSSTGAQAGTVAGATIANIIPSTSGFTFQTIGGTRASVPACASTTPDLWGVDVSTP